MGDGIREEMTRRSVRASFRRSALLVLSGAGLAIAAWQAGRTTERNAARRVEKAHPTVVASVRDSDRKPVLRSVLPDEHVTAVRETIEATPPQPESGATFVLPVLEIEERPTPAPAPPAAVAFPPRENRPADSPARCILLQAYPSSVSAYGVSGEVVQLVVRARNGCFTNFGGASFRAVAVGPEGREVAAASGRFSGAIPAGGSAETLIAIPTKPSPGLSYRAEVLGY